MKNSCQKQKQLIILRLSPTSLVREIGEVLAFLETVDPHDSRL